MVTVIQNEAHGVVRDVLVKEGFVRELDGSPLRNGGGTFFVEYPHPIGRKLWLVDRQTGRVVGVQG